MESKSALLVTTLALLITASSTFADETSNTYTKTEKAEAASQKTEVKPAKEAKEKAEAEPEPAEKATRGGGGGRGPMPDVIRKKEYKIDPCHIDSTLPGCKR